MQIQSTHTKLHMVGQVMEEMCGDISELGSKKGNLNNILCLKITKVTRNSLGILQLCSSIPLALGKI